MAAIVGAVLGGVRIDRHAADRIENLAVGGRGVIVGMGVIVLMMMLGSHESDP
jgi:hypothetical protein